jgi:Rps23 Pro-64 3,4-dihydroxylase Tpa1-like proline 4-hydroxylase
MLGLWINELPEFKNNTPFPNAIIDNFLNEDFANALINEFPPMDDPRFHRYHNPIEKKYATKNFDGLPEATKLYDMFQSDYFLDILRKLTGIYELEADPHLHGAGLAFHKNGGKLDMHLDYSIHPISKMERRINIILYLNKDWKYGGDLQLWDAEFTHCVKKVEAAFNQAIIFQTSDLSYHGLPTPIKCPDDMRRCSAGVYYVSKPREHATHRYKAQFFPLPDQPKDPRLMKLYDIRVNRTITDDDLNEIFPNWEDEGNGYW